MPSQQEVTTLQDFSYVPYRGTPAAHGFYLMRLFCRPEWLRQPTIQLEPTNEQPLFYGNFKQARYSYDKNAAYLCACLSVKLPVYMPDGSIEYHQVLHQWAKYLRWWREQAEPGSPARELVKQTYNITLGCLGMLEPPTQEDRIWRPDWRDLIIKHNKIVMQATIEKIEKQERLLPVAVNTDCLYYTQRVTSLDLNDRVCCWKEHEL